MYIISELLDFKPQSQRTDIKNAIEEAKTDAEGNNISATYAKIADVILKYINDKKY